MNVAKNINNPNKNLHKYVKPRASPPKRKMLEPQYTHKKYSKHFQNLRHLQTLAAEIVNNTTSPTILNINNHVEHPAGEGIIHLPAFDVQLRLTLVLLLWSSNILLFSLGSSLSMAAPVAHCSEAFSSWKIRIQITFRTRVDNQKNLLSCAIKLVTSVTTGFDSTSGLFLCSMTIALQFICSWSLRWRRILLCATPWLLTSPAKFSLLGLFGAWRVLILIPVPLLSLTYGFNWLLRGGLDKDEDKPAAEPNYRSFILVRFVWHWIYLSPQLQINININIRRNSTIILQSFHPC